MMRLKQHTFGHFLKKHGMVPPNMMGEEFDEENIIKEELDDKRAKRVFEDTRNCKAPDF